MAGPRVLLRHWRHGNTRYSLMRAGVNAEVVEAFDINDNANKVHQHNFGHRPYQGNIQSLTSADLDCLGRMHDFFLLLVNFTLDKKQSGDARAFSFLNILELIPRTSRPPMVLFVENVVGFEAKRKPSTFHNQVFDNQLLRSLGPLFGDANADETVFSKLDEPQESRDTLLEYCEPIESFLEFKNCSDQSESNFVGTTTGSTNTEGILKKDEGSGFCSGIVDQYIVPLSLVERWGSAMGILLRFYVQ